MNTEEFKKELAVIDEKIIVLSDKRAYLRQQIANLQSVFSVGSRVTYEGATCIWELSEIRPGWKDHAPEYIGSKIKKDGTPSSSLSRIYVPYGKTLIADKSIGAEK